LFGSARGMTVYGFFLTSMIKDSGGDGQMVNSNDVRNDPDLVAAMKHTYMESWMVLNTE